MSNVSKRARRSSRLWAVLLAGILCAVPGCDRGSHPEQLGRKAPVFALSDGQHSVDLAKLRGHVVVLNFWASWCGPCLEELPSLEQMQRELPQVDVIAVSTDESRDAYERFVTQHHVSLLTVQDPAQSSNALYGTFRYPETYVIDKNGVIRRKFIGPQEWTSPEIVGYLKKLAS